MDFQQWLRGGTAVAIILGVSLLVFWLGQALISFVRFLVSLFRLRKLVERVERIESQLQYPMMNQTTLSRLLLDNSRTIERLDMDVKALQKLKKKKS